MYVEKKWIKRHKFIYGEQDLRLFDGFKLMKYLFGVNMRKGDIERRQRRGSLLLTVRCIFTCEFCIFNYIESLSLLISNYIVISFQTV